MNLTVYQTLAALHHSQGYNRPTCLVKNPIMCVLLCGYLLMRISNRITYNLTCSELCSTWMVRVGPSWGTDMYVSQSTRHWPLCTAPSAITRFVRNSTVCGPLRLSVIGNCCNTVTPILLWAPFYFILYAMINHLYVRLPFSKIPCKRKAFTKLIDNTSQKNNFECYL